MCFLRNVPENRIVHQLERLFSERSSRKARFDAHFGRERAMDGALVCYFEESLTLVLVQISDERELAVDPVDFALSCSAFRAIGGVHFAMCQRDTHLFEPQLLALGIEPQCHRRARSQCGKQEVVRIRSGIVTAK
jgi:hypothetical protein